MTNSSAPIACAEEREKISYIHNQTVNLTKDWLKTLEAEKVIATKNKVVRHKTELLLNSIDNLKILIYAQQSTEFKYLEMTINSTEIKEAIDKFCLIKTAIEGKRAAGTAVPEDQIQSED